MHRGTFVAFVIILVLICILYCRYRCPCGCWTWCACNKDGKCHCCGTTGGSLTTESFIVNSYRQITYHYTHWCIHCKAMSEVWDRVKESLAGTGLEFKEIDEDFTRTPNITEYPTIMMITESGRAVKYKGPIDFEQLRNWIVSPRPYEY